MDNGHHELLAQTASMYYEQGMTQSAIAAELGLSRVKVYRLLKEAKAEQVVQIIINWPIERHNELEEALKGRFGACHALDLPFVFGTFAKPMWDEFVGKGPEVKILSEKIMDAWIAFARTGNPNHEGLPEWPRYDKETRATMELGKDCKVINAHFEKERAAWDGLLEV